MSEGRVFLLTGLLALGACAGSEFELAEGAPSAEEIRSVLLVPMNFDATPPVQLVPGVEQLEQNVAEYLATAGLRVERIGLAALMREWGAIAAERGFTAEGADVGAESIEDARAELVRRLLAARRTDAAVLPTLLIRQGWYGGYSLRWDGVTRPVLVEYERDTLMEVQQISGKGEGTSLRMALYAPDGALFFDRYAGLEPVVRFRMSGFGSTHGGRVDPIPRTDLFEDPEIIEDAVRLSLTPWISPTREAAAD